MRSYEIVLVVLLATALLPVQQTQAQAGNFSKDSVVSYNSARMKMELALTDSQTTAVKNAMWSMQDRLDSLRTAPATLEQRNKQLGLIGNGYTAALKVILSAEQWALREKLEAERRNKLRERAVEKKIPIKEITPS